MKTIEEIVALAKKLMTKHGSLAPTLLIEETKGIETRPLPDLPEAIKLSVLEGLGFTLAVEDRVGELVQVFLLAEGWRSSRNGPHAALRPEHDPDRVECVMVFQYQAEPETRQMVLYDIVRNAAGEPIELKPLAGPGDGPHTVESAPVEAVVRGFERGRVPA